MRLTLALCCAALLATTGTLLADSLPAQTVVHAGDQLDVQISGETDISQQVTVAGDGTIGLPLIGQVRVAGATPQGAGDAIASRPQRYVRDPHVNVNVISVGTSTSSSSAT